MYVKWLTKWNKLSVNATLPQAKQPAFQSLHTKQIEQELSFSVLSDLKGILKLFEVKLIGIKTVTKNLV